MAPEHHEVDVSHEVKRRHSPRRGDKCREAPSNERVPEVRLVRGGHGHRAPARALQLPLDCVYPREREHSVEKLRLHLRHRLVVAHLLHMCPAMIVMHACLSSDVPFDLRGWPLLLVFGSAFDSELCTRPLFVMP